MLFNSFSFLIFFPIVTLLYYLCPTKYRWVILLLSSAYFYAVFIPWYLLIFLATIFITFLSGIRIQSGTSSNRKIVFILAIMLNLLPLVVFKYLNFFNANIAILANIVNWNYTYQVLTLLLPLGISFHTFQSISYLVEVYRGKQKAERHPGIFALYLMFFPQLVAGPIERPEHMLHQFREIHTFDPKEVTVGLKRMTLGLFKKIVLADRLALIATEVFSNPSHNTNGVVLMGVIAFSFQIYCDFSGYSDIALGAARVLGFRLTENFKLPYSAQSVSDFWKRWHITLSTWFRDYIYIPLGGNRVSAPKQVLGIMVTFLLSGLWHGANWTFIFWGGLHGLAIAIEHGIESLHMKIPSPLFLKTPMRMAKTAITFLFITFAWIFFRAATVSDARLIIERLLNVPLTFRTDFGNLDFSRLSFTRTDIMLAIIGLTIMGIIEYVNAKQNWTYRSRIFTWIIYLCLVMAILNLGVLKVIPFIYFQF